MLHTSRYTCPGHVQRALMPDADTHGSSRSAASERRMHPRSSYQRCRCSYFVALSSKACTAGQRGGSRIHGGRAEVPFGTVRGDLFFWTGRLPKPCPGADKMLCILLGSARACIICGTVLPRCLLKAIIPLVTSNRFQQIRIANGFQQFRLDMAVQRQSLA